MRAQCLWAFLNLQAKGVALTCLLGKEQPLPFCQTYK